MVCEVIVSQCPPKHFIYNKQIEYDLFSNSIVSILRQPFFTLPFEILRKMFQRHKRHKRHKRHERHKRLKRLKRHTRQKSQKVKKIIIKNQNI